MNKSEIRDRYMNGLWTMIEAQTDMVTLRRADEHTYLDSIKELLLTCDDCENIDAKTGQYRTESDPQYCDHCAEYNYHARLTSRARAKLSKLKEEYDDLEDKSI